MQLRRARLCHDCEEVHDAQRCPVCASETFTYITRWVPAPERRARPRATTSPEAEVYRQLIEGDDSEPKTGRLFRQALIGVTTLGLAGWAWQRRQGQKDDRPADEETRKRPDGAPSDPSPHAGQDR